MKLKLIRRYKCEAYTIGTLYVDGLRFCDTLEDADRGLAKSMPPSDIEARKVKGKTAIPTGVYEIDLLTVSPRFRNRGWAKPYGGRVPRLCYVPCFAGVLIHPGNTAADTEGCILVGENKAKGKVVDSVATFTRLFDAMETASRLREKLTIEIR